MTFDEPLNCNHPPSVQKYESVMRESRQAQRKGDIDLANQVCMYAECTCACTHFCTFAWLRARTRQCTNNMRALRCARLDACTYVLMYA